MNDILKEIENLRRKKNVVILAHNYQRGEVQDIADFVGDSLELSRKAAETKADVILFCGVHFMAETAKILNPEKKVILPDLKAGCPLADMITLEQLKEMKKRYPRAKVVCYINTSALIKAYSDICCTSSNALKVVESIDADEIIFIPDMNLGNFVSKNTKKKIYIWEGFCPTHIWIKKEDILKLKEKHKDAIVMVHPECPPDVVEIADFVLSTGGMLKKAREIEAKEFIIGTENGIIHRLKKENPSKKFYPVSRKIICPNMKRITLEKVLNSLKTLKPEIEVEENIRIKAKEAIDKMLEIL
ncbi:MAG: quinolinate synthase NadA [Thermoanaerobaculia bacterium]